MTIAYPIKLKAKPSQYDQSKHTYDKWVGWTRDIANDVKGVIKENSQEAEAQMFKSVKEFILSIPDVADGKIILENFELEYYSSIVDSDGNVWIGNGVRMFHNFKN